MAMLWKNPCKTTPIYEIFILFEFHTCNLTILSLHDDYFVRIKPHDFYERSKLKRFLFTYYSWLTYGSSYV